MGLTKKARFQLPPVTLDFADVTIDEIEKLIHKSIHNEFGGVLCLDATNKIYLENIIKGDEEGIGEMPKDCEEGNRRIGSFHTHPKFDPEGDLTVERVSSGDYLYHEYNKDIITCIGHASTNKLTCLVSGTRNEEEEKELDKLISDLGEAEVYWQMIQASTRKEAEEEIRKEGHYEKLNKHYNLLNIDMS